MKDLNKKILLLFLSFFLSLWIAYVGYAVVRSLVFYKTMKTHQRGWRSTTFQYDPVLGYKHIPNSIVFESFPVGPDLPQRFDSEGFKIPMDHQQTSRKRPLILALGCSYTFGFGCSAEDSFPHLTAKLIGGSTINAGVCGYGLTQMTILSHRLIPVSQPDYVVVQYSPWLFDRALSGLAPSRFDVCSTPYFYSSRHGTIDIQLPSFIMMQMPSLESYRDSARGLVDYLSFCRRIALPLFLHGDKSAFLFHIKRLVRRLPPPVRDKDILAQHVYRDIFNQCKIHGAEMLILLLETSYQDLPRSIQHSDMKIIDGQAVLYNRLSKKSIETYYQEYYQWRGDPPQAVDHHPNAKAHAIIAEILSEVIGKDTLAQN